MQLSTLNRRAAAARVGPDQRGAELVGGSQAFGNESARRSGVGENCAAVLAAPRRSDYGWQALVLASMECSYSSDLEDEHQKNCVRCRTHSHSGARVSEASALRCRLVSEASKDAAVGAFVEKILKAAYKRRFTRTDCRGPQRKQEHFASFTSVHFLA